MKRRITEAFETQLDEIPDNLPLLEKLVDSYAAEQPLKGVTILAFQHQMLDQFVQTRTLIELGVRPQDIIWVDIPYSANNKIRQRLINELGLLPENFHLYQSGLLEPFVIRQRARANKVIRRLLELPPDELLVLDCGAYFIESAMFFEKDFPKLAIVEQTTRGMIKLADSAALQFEATKAPIVNVAESQAKSICEPPFIAMAITRALRIKLHKLDFTMTGKKVLILGYGRIGAAVARFIRDDLGVASNAIFIFDKAFQPHLSQEKIDGFNVWHRQPSDFKVESGFDLIIGCSGQSSFTINDYIFACDGALLVSCSSGQVEFARREFLEIADLHFNDDIKINKNLFNEYDLHADIPIQLPYRKMTMLNGSWPINFSGANACIPVEYVQPTICLMVHGAIQAVNAMRSSQTGIIEVDSDYQSRLVKGFRRLLGADADVLDDLATPTG